MSQKILPIGKVAKIIGVSIQTLRRWDSMGKLKSFRPAAGSHRYYREEDIEKFMNLDVASIAEKWVKNEHSANPEADFHCPTRDIFEGRLTKIEKDLVGINMRINLISLLVAITGEIGNNSFDHNLGAWPDIAGIFFGYDLEKKVIVMADRGQGVLKTLKRVKPDLKNDKEALKTAFTEIITARAPEERGNGLKFVKNIVTENPLTLFFQSGNAKLTLRQNEQNFKIQKTQYGFHGCLAIINF
ncbi:helix-turn-helix domain-containing protein [Patescibacteria group bacterium]|nr:helix-turn-helix domain-containing protein [Patescibacteria group bacterium]